MWLAIRALRLGVNVILDFGVWGKDGRSALRSLAAEAGANCELVYLAVDTAEPRRRVGARLSDTGVPWGRVTSAASATPLGAGTAWPSLT